ncbi:MAG: biopolymer transporter Tol [Verrucomicrobiota bacterium]
MRLPFLAGLAALFAASLTGQAATPDLQVIVDPGEVPIKISIAASAADLGALANNAFKAHGRYLIEAGAPQFALNFTETAAGQIRVDVRDRAGATVLSETATGKGEDAAEARRNALYRAADRAVKATSKLNGFFASRLAFVSTRGGKDDIYVGDIFCTYVNQVTFNRADMRTPRWSPDGGRLIFTSFFKNNRPDIYLYDFASGRTDTFASLEGTNDGARFSPDGRQVVMVLSGDGQTEIYTGASQGGGLRRLTRSDTLKSSPCWSPDGTRILFSGGTGPQLMLISAAGGTPQPLDLGGISSYVAEPDWSRGDPDKIAFTVRSGKNYQVAVASVASRSTKIISGKVPHTDVQEPVWLADGRHLICTAKAANVRLLYLVDTVTGKATRLDQAGRFGESSSADVCGP